MRAIVFLTCLSLAYAKLPKGWKSCKNETSTINNCLGTALESVIKALKNGDPKMGVLPVDPLHFDAVNIEQGNGPVKINLKFKNLDLYGLSNTRIDKVDYQPGKGYLKFRLNGLEPVVVKGNHTTNGRILILPINGKGKCSLIFENFSGITTIKGKIMKVKTKKNFYVDDFAIDIITSRLRMNFEGLFHGDKRMGDQMNKFLNENWEVILTELKPAISQAFGVGLKHITNKIFKQLPIDDMS